MECNFSLEHYSCILNNAFRAGYEFKGFHEPVPGNSMVIFLRHDIDVSVSMAVAMAELEASLGVRSTYFVLPNSPLYNLLEVEVTEILSKIRSMGHWIGLHVDLPNTPLLEGKTIEEATEVLFRSFSALIPFEPVVSYHRPKKEVFGLTFKSFTNTYENRFFKDIKYLSDSRKNWREGCPCQAILEGKHQQLQLLTHPVWWGTTDDLYSLGSEIIDNRASKLVDYFADNVTPFKVLKDNNYLK